MLIYLIIELKEQNYLYLNFALKMIFVTLVGTPYILA